MLPGLLDELRAHGCFVAQPTGVEADDVIVAVAHRARAKGIPSVVLSTDKDLASQACDLIRVRDHFAREWHDEAWCRAKFGVELSQLLDYLALVGDAVDGVQGVDKVGAKTAARLLTEHGTLEAVIGAAPTLKGVVGRNLQQQADRARLARRLVSFKVDAELGIDSFSQLRAPTAFA